MHDEYFKKKGGVSKRISFNTLIFADVYQLFFNSHITSVNNNICIVFQRKHYTSKKLWKEKITCIKRKMWCGPKKKEWEVSVIHKSFVTSVLALASSAFQLVWIICGLEFSNQWQPKRKEMKTKREKLLLFQIGPSHGRNLCLLEMKLVGLRMWIGISHFGAPCRNKTLTECERFQGAGHRQ